MNRRGKKPSLLASMRPICAKCNKKVDICDIIAHSGDKEIEVEVQCHGETCRCIILADALVGATGITATVFGLPNLPAKAKVDPEIEKFPTYEPPRLHVLTYQEEELPADLAQRGGTIDADSIDNQIVREMGHKYIGHEFLSVQFDEMSKPDTNRTKALRMMLAGAECSGQSAGGGWYRYRWNQEEHEIECQFVSSAPWRKGVGEFFVTTLFEIHT